MPQVFEQSLFLFCTSQDQESVEVVREPPLHRCGLRPRDGGHHPHGVSDPVVGGGHEGEEAGGAEREGAERANQGHAGEHRQVAGDGEEGQEVATGRHLVHELCTREIEEKLI